MTRIRKLQILNKEIADCRKCKGLNDPRKSPSAPGHGFPDAELMIIGQCLHAYNPNTNPQIPFLGPTPEKDSGILIMRALEKIPLNMFDKTKIFITNAVHCFCPGHRTPAKEEQENCLMYLNLEIKIVKPKFFLLLGAVARNAFGLKKPVREFSNIYMSCKDNIIIADHPSFIMNRAPGKNKNEKYITELLYSIKYMRKEYCK